MTEYIIINLIKLKCEQCLLFSREKRTVNTKVRLVGNKVMSCFGSNISQNIYLKRVKIYTKKRA